MQQLHGCRLRIISAIKKSILLSSCLLGTTYAEEPKQGFSAEAKVDIASDDNIFNRSNDVSDEYLALSPTLRMVDYYGKHFIKGEYSGEYVKFNDNDDLDYSQHELTLHTILDHSYRINSEFKYKFSDIIEEPGSTNSASLLINEFTEVEQHDFLARLYYGQKSSTGQLLLTYNFSDNEYQNNAQSYRDYDRNNFILTFFYRIAPKTRLLFETSLAEYNYDSSFEFGDQSSDQALYLAGVEWDLTAKTTGIFKVGYQDKDFEEDYFDDVSGLSYMLDMIWKPNTYTEFKVGASRLTTESAQLGIGGFISDTYSVDIKHGFTKRTIGIANIAYNTDDISWVQDRTDERYNLSLGLEHSLRTWLDISLEYKYFERQSDDKLYEFESNSFHLSFITKFD